MPDGSLSREVAIPRQTEEGEAKWKALFNQSEAAGVDMNKEN
jgi:hypothetical protein